MCETKPGPRCAPESAAEVARSADQYDAAYPGGPAVGALEGATASFATPVPQTASDLQSSLRARFPGVALDLHRSGDYTVLDRIVVAADLRGSGLGSAVMREIVEVADRNGWPLALTPSGDFGGTKSRLERFYRQFGFVPNKGSHKDYATTQSFVRQPR